MKTATSNQIKKELFRQLLHQSQSTLILGEAVATISFFGLLGRVDQLALIIWYTTVTLVTLIRLSIEKYLNRRMKSNSLDENLMKYILFYSTGTMIAGIAWASLIMLYQAGQPTLVQTYILVITIGIPMAALSTNAILPCTFYAFTLPLLAAILIWPQVLTDQVEIHFLLTAVIYSILVIVTGRKYHNNLRSSIENGLENHRLVEELRELAYIDHLTDLPNRRQFQVSAERTLARVKRSGASMALMLIDIDNFKFVNDTYGHEAGDELLMELANRIRHSIRINDIVTKGGSDAARLGGDEFIVMLECEHKDIEVDTVAKRILNNLRTSLKIKGVNYIPSVSIGIAIMPDHASDMRTLMSFADQAMYCAKQKGGNAFRVYGCGVKDACCDLALSTKAV